MSMSLVTTLGVASASFSHVLSRPLLKILDIVFVRLFVSLVHDFTVFLLSPFISLLIEAFLFNEISMR